MELSISIDFPFLVRFEDKIRYARPEAWIKEKHVPVILMYLLWLYFSQTDNWSIGMLQSDLELKDTAMTMSSPLMIC